MAEWRTLEVKYKNRPAAEDILNLANCRYCLDYYISNMIQPLHLSVRESLSTMSEKCCPASNYFSCDICKNHWLEKNFLLFTYMFNGNLFSHFSQLVQKESNVLSKCIQSQRISIWKMKLWPIFQSKLIPIFGEVIRVGKIDVCA